MELSKDIKKDLLAARKILSRALRKAKKDGTPEVAKKARKAFQKTREKLCQKELKRCRAKITGDYGGLSERGETGFSNEAAQALVDEAWRRLGLIAEELRTHRKSKQRRKRGRRLRRAMRAYETQEGRSPRFDRNSRVRKSAGGATRISRERQGDFIVQTGSGRILVGDRFITRKQERKYALKRILETLVHELMGHWARVGQKVRVDSNLTPEDQESVRRKEFEERADNIESAFLGFIKKTQAWKQFCDDLDAAAAERAGAKKERIQAEFEECLKKAAAGKKKKDKGKK